MQAGVDLGSVRADQEMEKKRRGKGKRQAAPLAQLRPKRRGPISQVLLVGGSTRMPAFRRFVLHMTALEPATFVQPDEVSTTNLQPPSLRLPLPLVPLSGYVSPNVDLGQALYCQRARA